MKRLSVRRVCASIAALAIVTGGFAVPAYAEPVSDDQLQQAKDAETQTADSIASLEVQLAQLAAQSNDLDMEVAKAQAAKIAADAAVDKAMDDLTVAEEAFLAAASDAEDARKELAQVSNEIYREGVGSIASANYLFGAESLSEANEKSRAYQMLGLDTDKQVQQYEALQAVSESLQKEMDKTVAGYTQAADDAAAAETAVTQAQADVDSQQASVQQQRDDLITQLAAQKGTTAELESQQQEQKEAAAKQEAAAEREQVIAAAQAAAPAATHNTNGGTSGGSSSSTATSGGTTSQPTAAATTQAPVQPTAAPTTQAPVQPTAAPTTQAPVQPSTPSTGSGTPQVIALAQQYIGYSYVWGTSGPNTFDCSGFTSFIYAKIGISLPLASAAQRWVGTQVSASEALPGDLMWWPGHVAIYMGNGQNIGAWNPSMGVRIGPNSWVNTDKGTQPIYLRLG